MKFMKVLLINGSPKANGNTARAIEELVKTFAEEGVETEVMHVGNKAIHGCIGCAQCRQTGKCVFDDQVNEAAAKLAEADGLVLASPVYYGSPNGTILSFLDRLFFSAPCDKTMKVGAGVAVARRGGCSSSFDVLNKYFLMNHMPVAPSQYWNSVHGTVPGDAEGDIEGLQTMRILARHMTFMMRSFALGKEKFGLPPREAKTNTNFIR